MNPNLGTGFYGGMIANPQPSGLHTCSLTDYYKTGEIALVGKVIALDVGCTQTSGLDGQAVTYYKDGTIKRREPWKSGKLNGTVVYYNEEGEETKRADYINGSPLDNGKFVAQSDSTITGTWGYTKYHRDDERSGIVTNKATFIYSPNGIVESIHESRTGTSKIKGNWKYIPKTASTGILEEYHGD